MKMVIETIMMTNMDVWSLRPDQCGHLDHGDIVAIA